MEGTTVFFPSWGQTSYVGTVTPVRAPGDLGLWKLPVLRMSGLRHSISLARCQTGNLVSFKAEQISPTLPSGGGKEAIAFRMVQHRTSTLGGLTEVLAGCGS